jgi:hypothetical protein
MGRLTKLAMLTAGLMLLIPAAGAQATQTASPTSLKFPPTTVGQQSTQTVTYSVDAGELNRGYALSIDCTLAQLQTCPFNINDAASTCNRSGNMPAGNSSCTFAVNFFPKLAGGQSQTLTITPTTKVPLSGVGLAAGGKGKKCKKKGKKRAAAAKKKKCGKKKK